MAAFPSPSRCAPSGAKRYDSFLFFPPFSLNSIRRTSPRAATRMYVQDGRRSVAIARAVFRIPLQFANSAPIHRSSSLRSDAPAHRDASRRGFLAATTNTRRLWNVEKYSEIAVADRGSQQMRAFRDRSSGRRHADINNRVEKNGRRFRCRERITTGGMHGGLTERPARLFIDNALISHLGIREALVPSPPWLVNF